MNKYGVFFMFTLFLFAFVAQSTTTRGQQSYYSLTNTTVDESKLVFKFCTRNACVRNPTCYCCMTENKQPPSCYDSLDYCQAACPACNPKCPHY
ncbi:hypothetical protein BS78_04G031300 [Paspalum vaginatum]|nr:hypothetical protein BS78_04G031300 [Paspalum vaginatum]